MDSGYRREFTERMMGYLFNPATTRDGVEQITHHSFRELAPIPRILDGRHHLDFDDPPVRCDPEADFVTTSCFTRRAGWRHDRPARRGGEDITRLATRARAGVGAHASASAGSRSTAAPRTLAWSARRAVAGPDRRRRGDSDGWRRQVKLHRLDERRGRGRHRD